MGEAWRRALTTGALDAPSVRCAEAPPPELVEGIHLFNAGRYFECHEVLEDIWHVEREPVRYLYQGVLQIGVGFYHWRRNNHRGARLLLGDGIEKVSRFLPVCMTVDTANLRDGAQACLDLLLQLGPERMADFDWSRVPVIRFIEADQ